MYLSNYFSAFQEQVDDIENLVKSELSLATRKV